MKISLHVEKFCTACLQGYVVFGLPQVPGSGPCIGEWQPDWSGSRQHCSSLLQICREVWWPDQQKVICTDLTVVGVWEGGNLIDCRVDHAASLLAGSIFQSSPSFWCATPLPDLCMGPPVSPDPFILKVENTITVALGNLCVCGQ